jgi:hypothetical protein
VTCESASTLDSLAKVEKEGVLDDKGRAIQCETRLGIGVPGLFMSGKLAKIRPPREIHQTYCSERRQWLELGLQRPGLGYLPELPSG